MYTMGHKKEPTYFSKLHQKSTHFNAFFCVRF